MAEVVGIVASIAQIANAGIALSTALYDFASRGRRAEQELADIADDVKTAAIALDGIARVIQQDGEIHDVSKNAVSEAIGLSQRCDAVFGEIQDFIAKISKPDQNETELSNALQALKERKFELLRRRLDDVKHSITLLLHVLRLANAQAKGNVEHHVLLQEREIIRELHQRQQESHEALQALESRLGDSGISHDQAVNGSAAPSRVPTINFLVNSSARGVSRDGQASGVVGRTAQAPSALGDFSETSESDDTITDDGGEHLTVDDLARCANRIQKLLERVTVLHQRCETEHWRSQGRVPRNKVLKHYRRFCRKFESEIAVQETATPTVAPLPRFAMPSHQAQHSHTHDAPRNPQPQLQHHPRILPEPSGVAPDRPTHAPVQFQSSNNIPHAARSATEMQYTAPAWTISSEPLGAGSRPKLPPLISTVPSASQASPTNEIMSPGDDHDGKHSGTDGEHGSHENGPVVYTKTGRISKAKKGLKVHVCEECGRSFTRAEHLRRHQKNHGPNQVRCELCGKVFFRADLLQRHLERHKDLPQGYRFSNHPLPTTEGMSPIPSDEAHHRHILPAPGHPASGAIPHHSPSGRSVGSSGASGAPTPSEVPAASPTIAHQSRSAWGPPNDQSAMSHVPEERSSQRLHAWQTVNVQERGHNPPEISHSYAASPASQQQSHSGLPKLQPKIQTVNGAANHKRYSNILPAPDASSGHSQHAANPQGHIPNMLPTLSGPATHYDPHYVSQGLRITPINQDSRITSHSPTTAASATRPGLPVHPDPSQHQIGIHSPTPPTQLNASRNTTFNLPARTSEQGTTEQPTATGSISDSYRSHTEARSSKLSSDKEGVNWRLAATDSHPYRKRKHSRNVSQTDGDSSGVDDTGRTPEGTQRSHSGSRSLSLVTPQDERDRALLGKLHREDRQLAELSPHGGPPVRALSPAIADRRSMSRPSTGKSDQHQQAGTETPEPESPYSLATINRYIENRGPKPGAEQDDQPADQATHIQPTNQISLAPCERCREYSIKCDGRLPECTACATTKYAGECSFASMSAHAALSRSGSIAGPSAAPKYFDDMSTMTRQAMAEPESQPRKQTAPRYPSGTLHPDQGYNSDEDLPSPYLRPRDKEQQMKLAPLPVTALPGQAAESPTRKRKVGDGDVGDERKKVKERHGEGRQGKDIVDVLLGQFSVPAR